MRKQFLLVLILVLIKSIPLFSQTTFQKVYGGVGGSEGVSIEQTNDKGYIISGNSEVGVNGNNIHVSKFDSLGTLQWSKKIGYYNQYGGGIANVVKQTKDNGFIIAGYTDTSKKSSSMLYTFRTPTLIKMDALGGVKWIKSFHSSYPSIDFNSFNSLQITSDGDYLMCGSYSDSASGYVYPYIVKTDSVGNLQWSKMYAGFKFGALNDIVEGNKGGYLAVGSFGDSFSTRMPLILNLDSNGNIYWARKYMISNCQGFNNIRKTVDHSYLISNDSNVSSSNFNSGVMKMDSSFIALWAFNFADSLGTIIPLQTTKDGGFIASGKTESNVILLIKVDKNGNIQWNDSYGGNVVDLGLSICTTSDGGYAVTGNTLSFGEKTGPDLYIIKMDSNGYAGNCNKKNLKILRKSFPVNFATITLNEISNNYSINHFLPEYNVALTEASICQLCSFTPPTTSKTLLCGTKDIVTINAQNSGSKYLWSTGEQSQSIKITNGNAYWVRITNDSCQITDTIHILQILPPNLGKDTMLCLSSGKLQLHSPTNWSKYYWSTGDTTHILSVQKSGAYSLTASRGNCTLLSDSIHVNYLDPSLIFIPNLITINGDGRNDFFEILNSPIQSNLSIYDRWGTRVYQTSDYQNNWNGNESPGVYYYHYETECKDSFKGWVEIVK